MSKPYPSSKSAHHVRVERIYEVAFGTEEQLAPEESRHINSCFVCLELFSQAIHLAHEERK